MKKSKTKRTQIRFFKIIIIIIIVIVIIIFLFLFFFLEITNFKEEEGRNKQGIRRRIRIREVPPLKMGTPQASQPALASSSKVLLQSGNFPSKRKRPQKPSPKTPYPRFRLKP
jgi:flagellar basal body-associated protein FliL